MPRSKRPYDALGSTQKWKRRKQAREAWQAIDCPPMQQPAVTAADVLHLPTAVREQIRSVRGLSIPCEQTIIRCKKALASSHATETGTFANGAYITDPVRFVSVLCAQSPFLAVGGDTGDGLTKLGITYSTEAEQHFAALVVYEGGDNWEALHHLTEEVEPSFIGDSAAFPHIFTVLQHLIDTRAAFLNGDWCFLNAVLGLMSPSATHPCPICIISFNSFTKSSRYRNANDKHSIDRTHRPLLTISPDRIVPTPLHLFLGISNRIILDAFSELLGKELVEETLEAVKTVHSAGCGGKSDLFQLNGAEIRKWIKKDCSNTLRTSAEKDGDLTADQKSTFTTLKRWLENLHDYLLHKREWTTKEIEDWRAVVHDIQKNWCGETGQSAFPKLHMLLHTLEFAERYRFLGRASEAQIESYHYQFKRLYHQQHLNSAHNESQRICRSLADTTLRALQPFLQQ
jgi:hypothetical protein